MIGSSVEEREMTEIYIEDKFGGGGGEPPIGNKEFNETVKQSIGLKWYISCLYFLDFSNLDKIKFGETLLTFKIMSLS